MKVAFIYHSKPHSSHAIFAKSIGSEFIDLPYFPTSISFLYNLKLLTKYDILFTESAACLLPAILVKMAKRKFVLTIAMDPLYHPVYHQMPTVKRKYLLSLLKYVDGFIAVSEMMKILVQKIVSRPVEVVYPPIVNIPKTRSNIKNNNVLFIGHARRSKGYIKLIKAFELLEKENRNYKLYLIGKCCYDVKNYFPKIPRNVHLEGFVPNIDPYFNLCSYYVHPADFDPAL